MSQPSRSRMEELFFAYEGVVTDSQISELLNAVLQHSKEDQSRYCYLLGRLYEVLGCYASYTPELTAAPKLFWHEAIRCFERSAASSPDTVAQFLRGKLAFRKSLTYALRQGLLDRTLLLQAISHFHACFQQELDTQLKRIYLSVELDARMHLYHEEAINKLHRIMLESDALFEQNQTEWKKRVEMAKGVISDYDTTLTTQERNLVDDNLCKNFLRFLTGERLRTSAELRELLHDNLLRKKRTSRGAANGSSAVAEFLDPNQKEMLSEYGRSADILLDIGQEIRASYTKAYLKKKEADRSFFDVIELFKATMTEDESFVAGLKRADSSFMFNLPADQRSHLLSGAVEDTLKSAFSSNNAPLSIGARLTELQTSEWLVIDNGRRFRIEDVSGDLQVFDASRQAILFDYREYETFHKYGNQIKKTGQKYVDAIKETDRLLDQTRQCYTKLFTSIEESGRKETNEDVLALKLSAKVKELEGSQSTGMRMLWDRVVYIWSLLEMFQMRNGSVRLNTLFSGECRLIMENPYEYGKHMEVGGDPIFRMAMPLLFRRSSGDDEIRRFVSLILNSVVNTFAKQRLALRSEFQFIDPNLNMEKFKQINARLLCHENLARAILAFADILLLPLETIRVDPNILEQSSDKMEQFLSAADLQQPHAINSSLIGKNGLEFFRRCMRGIVYAKKGILGQNESWGTGGWEELYDKAATELQEAEDLLERIEDAYLFSDSDSRAKAVSYIRAYRLNVNAWKCRHQFEGRGNPQYAKDAQAKFDEVGQLYKSIGDLHGLTQARARASEMLAQVYLSDGGNRDSAYRLLKEAIALFATCSDVNGFKATKELLVKNFPSLESDEGLDSLAFLEVGPSDSLALGFVYLSEIHHRILKEIDAAIPDAEEEKMAFEKVFKVVLNFAAQEFQQPSLARGGSESECSEALLRFLRRPFGESVIPEKNSGKGLVDIVAERVPIEVKRVNEPSALRAETSWLKQITSYISADGRRIGLLVIFDFTSKDKPPDNLDMYVSTLTPETYRPDAEEPSRIRVVKIMIPYYDLPPSKMK